MIKDRLEIVEHTGMLQYMGVLIIGGKLKRVDCSHVEHVIQECLEGWSVRALFVMGRIILVRSVLNSIISKTLVSKLEQYFYSFFMGLAS